MKSEKGQAAVVWVLAIVGIVLLLLILLGR